MHYRFEIPLIVAEVMADPVFIDHSEYGHEVIRDHLQRYLLNYYRQNTALPTGRCYLGMTRPLNIEIGMVDFDVVRGSLRKTPSEPRSAIDMPLLT